MKHTEHTARFAGSRLNDRDMDEFIGICKGIIFDGLVCEDEARNQLIWLTAHPAVANTWPRKPVFAMLGERLKTTPLSADDEGELLALLTSITGNPDTVTQGQQSK